MHYDKDYSKLSGPAKAKACMHDIRSYMGKAFDKTVTNIRRDYENHGPPPLRAWIMSCSVFAGIEGIPVLYFYNYVFNTELTEADYNAAHKAIQSEQAAAIRKVAEAADRSAALATSSNTKH